VRRGIMEEMFGFLGAAGGPVLGGMRQLAGGIPGGAVAAGTTSTAAERARNAARNWLGEGAVLKSSRTSVVIQSKDELRQLRLDLTERIDRPHAHLEVFDPVRRRFIDAPGVPHRIYFEGTSNP